MSVDIIHLFLLIVFTSWLCWKILDVAGYLLCGIYTRLAIHYRNTKQITTGKPSKISTSSRSIETFVQKRNFKRWMNGYYRFKIIRTGNIASQLVRKLIYSQIFKVTIKNNVIIYFGAEIRKPYNLELGQGTIIGDRAILDARSGIIIGENVNLSSDVHIWTLQHNYNCPHFTTKDQDKPVIINDRVWLGPRVTILPGVTIGEGAVIGAGAVVTKDVDPYTINAGIPSKKIGVRNSSISYSFSGHYLPFL
jgi:acetyltransferase-like isoleucine patch superfamily enzyme